MLEQWDQGRQAIFVANPDYYGEAPKMERVTVMFMEEDAALAAAQSGDVDIAYTSATLSDSVPEDYELLVCESVDSRGISLPVLPSGSDPRMGMDGAEHEVGNDVTSSLALRQAMNYGVDREGMIKNVLNGYGTVAYSVGDGMPWSSEDMKVDYDVDKAKQILADDGWKAGSDGVLEKDGTRASFQLLYSAGDSVRQALATEFANQMAELGIEVEVKGGDWDTDLYPHQFDTPILWGWGSNAPVEMYELTYSTGWGNVACYDNETVDANLDAALAASSIEDSYDFYKKAQWDEKAQVGIAPKGASTWIWLANIDHLYFQRKGLKVAEQKPHPHGHGWSLANNVDQWTWE
jgi:peptide/nickel transport system substrate-binding protein